MLTDSSSYEGQAWWRAEPRRWDAPAESGDGGGCLRWWDRHLGTSPGLSKTPPCSLPVLCLSPSPAGRRACSSAPLPGKGWGGERQKKCPPSLVSCHLQPPRPAVLATLLSLLLARAFPSSLEPQMGSHPSALPPLTQEYLCPRHCLAQGLP